MTRRPPDDWNLPEGSSGRFSAIVHVIIAWLAALLAIAALAWAVADTVGII